MIELFIMAIETQVSPPPKAWLRRTTEEPIRQLAKKIHEKWPRVTANHVTAAGLAGQIAAVTVAERENRKVEPNRAVKTAAIVGATVSFAADGIDGALSRVISEESSLGGAIGDLFADRAGEILTAVARAKTAHRRGGFLGRVGEWAALAVAATTTLPTVARLHANKHGKMPPEHGSSITEAIGTRPGRVISALTATAIPRAQPMIDTIGFVASVNTARKRWNVASDPNAPELPPEKKDGLELQRLIFAGVALAGLATAVHTYRRERKRDRRLKVR